MKMNLLFKNSGANVILQPTHPSPERNYRTKKGEKVYHQRNIVFNAKTIKREQQLDDPYPDLLNKDDEFDMELAGKTLDKTSQIVVDKDLTPVHSYKITEVLYRPDGNITEREYKIRKSNIDQEIPVLISQTLYNPKELLTQYVFRKSYFLIHADQMDFGVLYDIASYLDKEQKFAKVSTFKPETKEITPLILNRNGTLYSAVFLEGHVRNNSEYSLILHLSDYELKTPEE